MQLTIAVYKKNPIIILSVVSAVIVLLLCATTVLAASPQTLENKGTAKTINVIDGDTITLDDGREIRLVGIQAPKIPLGRDGFKAWPLAEAAKKEMEKLSIGKSVTIYTGETPIDRHGRTLGHVMVNDNTNAWLQGEMLRRGLARVYTFNDNRALANEMLEIEKTARQNNIGIWAKPFYKIISDIEAADYVGTFQLIEGKVLSAQRVGTRVYLNFGPIWRTDFTILIEKDGLKMFAKSNIDPLSFQGKYVRVRGWIKNKNGPMIEASHPEQIENIN